MTSLLEKASTFFSSHISQFRLLIQSGNDTRAVIVSALSATVVAVTLPRIYRDYRTFISYGPGGVPYNLIGWFAASVILPPWGREMFSTGVYEEKIAAGETTSYLGDEWDLLRKRDHRPQIGPHIVPQRQITEFPSEEIKEVCSVLLHMFICFHIMWFVSVTDIRKCIVQGSDTYLPGIKKLNQDFYAFANRNQHLVGLSPSKLELHADALFLADGLVPTPAAQQLKGEIAHIHRLKDFSLHVTLAPADCMIPLSKFCSLLILVTWRREAYACFVW